jgi:hypothetical protein
MLRQHMRCDAPSFSLADYDHIMQCAERKPRDKVLKDLTDKYHTSQKRIYQIWRGEEKNRVAWNQPIHMPTASLSNINVVDGRTEPEIQGQDVSPFTELEKEIRDAKIEPSKSIGSVLEEGGKVKKTGERKSRTKTVCAFDSISSTESSEDVLDLYKRTGPDIEKVKLSGRPLIPK